MSVPVEIPENLLKDYKKAASLKDIPKADNVIVVRGTDIERYSMGKKAEVIGDSVNPDVAWGFTLKKDGNWEAKYGKDVPHIAKKEIDDGNVYVSRKKAEHFSLEEWEHPNGRKK